MITFFLERRFSIKVRCVTVGFVVFLVTMMYELCFKKRIKSIEALRKNPEFFEVEDVDSKTEVKSPLNGF